MWVFVICFQSNYMCSCSVYSQQRNKLLLAKLLNKHKLFYAKKKAIGGIFTLQRKSKIFRA